VEPEKMFFMREYKIGDRKYGLDEMVVVAEFKERLCQFKWLMLSAK